MFVVGVAVKNDGVGAELTVDEGVDVNGADVIVLGTVVCTGRCVDRRPAESTPSLFAGPCTMTVTGRFEYSLVFGNESFVGSVQLDHTL